ncbi:pentapeptide repeat-containing protein [Streptomyces sp. NP-1717]|nr:pentapeptide repeat-containing protein [Streptomyces sp. NP-1717]
MSPTPVRRPRLRRRTPRPAPRRPAGRPGAATAPQGGLDWARRIELVSVLLASLVAVAGLWYSSVQTRQANQQARDDRALAKEGQITDRYTAAVGNLGEDKMDIRLGGIYALQRIMQDSTRDQSTIANVLATYVRTHAVKPPAKYRSVPEDIHAALIVLTTRETAHDAGFRLDLRGARLQQVELAPVHGAPGAALAGADLRAVDLNHSILDNADLSGADLSGANLNGASVLHADLRQADLGNADLHYANLSEADLSDTNLFGVNLSRAQMFDADLSGAELFAAELSDAVLSGADLSGADLKDVDLDGVALLDTNLSGANLAGADLRGARHLTKEQLNSARVDGKTRLPASLS